MNVDNIIIRQVSIDDLLSLQKIGLETFKETFSSSNTEENLKTYLDSAFKVDKLMTELNNPFSAFYFSELENDVIGYLKLNFGNAQTELKDNNSVEIERIYVLK